MLKYLFLIAVFIGIGINDFAIKVYKCWRPEQEEPFFIFFIFSSAFIYSSIYIISKKVKISKNTVLLGLVLGIPNVFSTFFLLGALALLPAILVYPLMNVGIILFTTAACVSNLERKIKPLGSFSSRQRSVGNFVFKSWWMI